MIGVIRDLIITITFGHLSERDIHVKCDIHTDSFWGFLDKLPSRYIFSQKLAKVLASFLYGESLYPVVTS